MTTVKISTIRMTWEKGSKLAKIDYNGSVNIFLSKEAFERLLFEKQMIKEGKGNEYLIPNYELTVSPPKWEIVMKAPVLDKVSMPVNYSPPASILDFEIGETEIENNNIICSLSVK